MPPRKEETVRDWSTIISALITGSVAIAVCVINTNTTNRKRDHEQDKRMMELNASYNQSVALIECKIENLVNEVSKHNNFAMQIPVIEEKIRVINKRIEDLERHEERRNDKGASIGK